MSQPEPMHKRVVSLDGSTFRCERKNHVLFVNDMPAQVRATDRGVVELVAEQKTVQVSGATYWELIYDDLVPTKLLAGMILAKYDDLAGRLQRIATEKSQEHEGKSDDVSHA